MTLFHVTPSHNVPSIFQKGLVPQIGANSRTAKENKPEIYLFPDWDAVETALLNWLGDEFGDTPLTLLRVCVPEAAIFHKGNSFEYICRVRLPPEDIQIAATL